MIHEDEYDWPEDLSEQYDDDFYNGSGSGAKGGVSGSGMRSTVMYRAPPAAAAASVKTFAASGQQQGSSLPAIGFGGGGAGGAGNSPAPPLEPILNLYPFSYLGIPQVSG